MQIGIDRKPQEITARDKSLCPSHLPSLLAQPSREPVGRGGVHGRIPGPALSSRGQRWVCGMHHFRFSVKETPASDEIADKFHQMLKPEIMLLIPKHSQRTERVGTPPSFLLRPQFTLIAKANKTITKKKVIGQYRIVSINSFWWCDEMPGGDNGREERCFELTVWESIDHHINTAWQEAVWRQEHVTTAVHDGDLFFS